VPREEIAANGYDLSINRYKEIEYEEVQYDPPKVILQRLRESGGRDPPGFEMPWRRCWDEVVPVPILGE
jgi:hypothetical protein